MSTTPIVRSAKYPCWSRWLPKVRFAAMRFSSLTRKYDEQEEEENEAYPFWSEN